MQLQSVPGSGALKALKTKGFDSWKAIFARNKGGCSGVKKRTGVHVGFPLTKTRTGGNLDSIFDL